MAINWILERVEESASTNEDLMIRWRQGLLWEPIARLALKQTAGKGRLGRTWVSTPHETLTFSVAYPFKKPISALSGLSLACGLAIIRGISQAMNLSLSELHQHRLCLKWPNDILIHEKKVAGLLSQATDDGVILGIGLNVSMYSDELPVPTATSLLIEKFLVLDRNEIILEFLKNFNKDLEHWNKEGSSAFITSYENVCSSLRREIEVILPNNKSQRAIAIGISPSGELILNDGAHVNSADIIHLR